MKTDPRIVQSGTIAMLSLVALTVTGCNSQAPPPDNGALIYHAFDSADTRPTSSCYCEP